jgi:hypothetical protein
MTTKDNADMVGSFGFASRDHIAQYDTLLRVDVRIGKSGQRSRPHHRTLQRRA